jgi:hypothetical protein
MTFEVTDLMMLILVDLGLFGTEVLASDRVDLPRK